MADAITNDPSLNRRDFLKIVASAVPALAIDPSKWAENAEKEWTLPVEFRFGDHILHKEDVNPDKYALILGELSEADIYYWHRESDNPLPEDKSIFGKIKKLKYVHDHAGIGSPPDDSQNHLRYLSQSRKLDINLVATDVRKIYSLTEESSSKIFSKTEPISKTRRVDGLLISSTIPLPFISSLLPMYLQEQIKPYVKNVPLLREYIENIDRIFLGSFTAEMFAYWAFFKYPEQIKNVLQTVLDKKEDAQLGQFITQFRNTSMVHNCRLIEAYLAQSPDLRGVGGLTPNKKALIIAGTGHSKLEDEYQKGVVENHRSLKRFAEEDVKFGFKFIKSVLNAPHTNSSEKDALDLFVYITQGYGYPVATFFDSDVYRNGAKMAIPDSGRLILWGELIKACSNASANDAITYKKMASRLLKEDLVAFSAGTRSVNPENQAMFDRMLNIKKTNPQDGIDMSTFLGDQPASGARTMLYMSEGIPFFIDQMPDGNFV